MNRPPLWAGSVAGGGWRWLAVAGEGRVNFYIKSASSPYESCTSSYQIRSTSVELDVGLSHHLGPTATLLVEERVLLRRRHGDHLGALPGQLGADVRAADDLD